MHHQREASSSSVRSAFSDRSLLSTLSENSKTTPVFPSPSWSQRSASSGSTPHKRDRFKTLFFTPSIRDSGISLSTPTSDPRFFSPLTPPSFPIPAIPADSPFLQDELDYLVDELASQFCYEYSDAMGYSNSDRCDSPTLGSSSNSWTYPDAPVASRPPSIWSAYDKNGRRQKNGHESPLPGASHPNSPVQSTIRPKPNFKPYSRSASRARPVLGLPQTFRRLAITDPNIGGQPIRFLSPDYVAGANSLKIGSCTFLNLAYGADVECGLRVEPQGLHGPAAKKQVVILQVVQRVVKVHDASTAWLMCSETDVTSAFTPEVRAELATRAQQRLPTPPLRTRTAHGRALYDEEQPDIWLSLANTLSSNYAPTTTPLPASTASSPSPILKDLLSLLNELRFLHRQFFILHQKWSARPQLEFGIPYVSASLYTSLTSQSEESSSGMGYDPKSNRNIAVPSGATPTTQAQNALSFFRQAAMTQANVWLSQTPGATILRETLTLPEISGFAKREEHIGIFGVWVGEDWGEQRTGPEEQGCWICFVVPSGVEMDL